MGEWRHRSTFLKLSRWIEVRDRPDVMDRGLCGPQSSSGCPCQASYHGPPVVQPARHWLNYTLSCVTTLAANFLFTIPKLHKDIRHAWCEDDPGMRKMRWKVKPESKYLFLASQILQCTARAYLPMLHTSSAVGLLWRFNIPGTCLWHTLQLSSTYYYADKKLYTRRRKDSKQYKANDTNISHLIYLFAVYLMTLSVAQSNYSGTSVVERLSSRTNRFPNIKRKQKTHRFQNSISIPKQANWQPGTWDVRRESLSYVAASAQCSLLFRFAVPFLDFLCVLLFFY
jgi:hypothetical protein